MLLTAKFRPNIFTVMVLCVGSALITYLVVRNFSVNNNSNADITQSTPVMSSLSFSTQRLGGYTYIRPLMFVETANKSAVYETMTQSISSYIESKKQTHDIAGAAFYFRNLDETEWTGYNEEDKYYAGSLTKVPVLISYLKMEEDEPGTLNRQLYYSAPIDDGKTVWIKSKQIEPGRSYTVKELLHCMIAYSDNNATSLLDNSLPVSKFKKTFTDLGLKEPDMSSQSYQVSPKDYSLFMRAIYNAAYLTIAHSEFAAELLSSSEFKDGFKKGFPEQVKLIHKFGESGTPQEHHLSESGIVYINNKCYLLTVMTKGADLDKLKTIISDISGMVYQHISGA